MFTYRRHAKVEETPLIGASTYVVSADLHPYAKRIILVPGR